MGPIPQFSSRDLRVSGTDHLPDAMKRAREVLDSRDQVTWQEVSDSAQVPPTADRPAVSQHVKQSDLNHIDRNIDALVHELVQQCQRVFSRAAGATGRSASVTPNPHSMARQAVDASATHDILTRERLQPMAFL